MLIYYHPIWVQMMLQSQRSTIRTFRKNSALESEKQPQSSNRAPETRVCDRPFGEW